VRAGPEGRVRVTRTAHLIHGIRSENGGAPALLKDFFDDEGFRVKVYDYGYARGYLSRFQNGRRAAEIARQVGPDDILVGHSNGGTLCWMIQDIVPVCGMVLIHPALDEDKLFPRARWVDVYHNEEDLVCEASEALGLFDWLWPHHYGRLGRIGYRGADHHVTSIDDGKLTINLAKITGARLPPVHEDKHSGMFAPTHLEPWGRFYALRARLNCERAVERDAA
jgi:pimeloyl-ACP methyl ester carboxylesterase